MTIAPVTEALYILTVDQSTTGTKAILTDRSGSIRFRYAVAHRQMYPQDGWVEHDPVEIFTNVKTAIRGVIAAAGATRSQIAGLTVTNQRETAVLWDRESGLPVGNAIVWQCRRTADTCDQLKQAGWEERIREKTGLLLDPYFSAAKWRWLLEHRAGQLEQERLMAGTIDSWLIWKLTAGKVHATDYSNASRTQLFNIHTLQWDEELAGLFGIPLHILPSVLPSDRIYGIVADPELLPYDLPITGVVGDSQGALFGQQCIRPGMAKGTFGTGTSVMLYAGGEPPVARNGLVTAIAWGMGDGVKYALEAILHSTGDCLNWVKEQLGLFHSYEELEGETNAIADTGGVYLVPAFLGLGAPYWNPRARAAITGLNRNSGRREIMRAAVESIAHQVADAVSLLEQETGSKLTELRVDGGATANRLLMQLQADLLDADVVCSEAAELSALGSAYMGGIALGFWKDSAALEGLYHESNRFSPAMREEQRRKLRHGWLAAVTGILATEEALGEEEHTCGTSESIAGGISS